MLRPLEIDGFPTAVGATLTPAVAVAEQEGGRTSTSSSPEAMSTRRRGSNDNHTSQYHATMPDSPRSFDSNELFEDVLDETNNNYGLGRDRITDDDLERLMGNDYSDENEFLDYRRQQSNNTARPSTSMQQQRYYHRFWSWMCPSFCHASRRRQQRIGNMIILSPYCVAKFNFCIIGPHWFGPVACLTLLTGATSRLVPRSYRTVGPITAQTCLGFYLVSVLLLGLVVCRDPGVVRATPMEGERDEQTSQIVVEDEGTDGVGRRVDVGSGGGLGSERGLVGRGSGGGLSNAIRMTGRDDGWRYCDLCSVYQPPGAVHCPDCNVCIKGFDHHCPWMGTCIGEMNYTPFLAFNITWLIYLFYAIVWVLNVGAQLYYRAHHPSSSVTPNDDDET